MDIIRDQTERSHTSKVPLYADPDRKFVIGHMVSKYDYYNHNDMNSNVICYPVSKILIFNPSLGSTVHRMVKMQYMATENSKCEMPIMHKENMPNLKSATRVIEKVVGDACYSRIDLSLL
jgi:hypothetical protein